jgi:hypothetical protein
MMKKIASCNVFFRKKDILVASSARTTAGFEIITDPVFKLERSQSAQAIGQVVLESMNAYRIDVPPPGPDMNSMPNPLLDIAGCRSWTQLDKSSINVMVNRYPDFVVAVPTQRDVGGGAKHLNEIAIECEATVEKVGEAVLKAAALSS